MTDDIRGALIRAVPPLTAPPDRIVQVRRRAARTRGRRTALSLIAAAAATGLAIATPALLSAAGSGRADSRTAGDRPANQPFPTGAAPTSGPAGPDGTDGVGTGRCPAELDLMSQTPAVVAGQDQRLPALPLRAVTLCRYRHVAFDLSAGTARRRAGPVQAPPGEFGAPVDTYVDQRIWRPPSTGFWDHPDQPRRTPGKVGRSAAWEQPGAGRVGPVAVVVPRTFVSERPRKCDGGRFMDDGPEVTHSDPVLTW